MKKQLYIFFFFLFTAKLTHGQFSYTWPAACNDHIFVHTDRDYYLAGETIWLRMYCVQEPGIDTLKSSIGYLELASIATGSTVYKLKVALNGTGAGTINLADTLSTGTYNLYAYTSKSIDSAYAFKKRLFIQNTFDTTGLLMRPAGQQPTSHTPEQQGITLKADSPLVYGRRQKVKLFFQLPSFPKNTLPSKFSLSVYRLDGLWSPAGQTISSIRSTTGMTRFPIRATDPVEDNGPILTGHVTDTSGAPVGKLPLLLSIPGPKPRYYGVETRQGRFVLEPHEFSGDVTLLAMAPGHKINVNVDDKFKNIITYDREAPVASAPLDSSLIAPLTREHIAMQVQRVFYADSNYLVDPYNDSTGYYGHYDESLILDDYTRFTTFEEVFREMVKTVMVRKVGDTLYLKALNNSLVNPKFFDDPAFVLLDGVPLYDNKKLFSIDPLKIRKVSVYAHRVFFGPFVFPGIVLLQTYNGDLAGVSLDQGTAATDLQGTALDQPFFSPDYSSNRHETLPDQRTLLYWQPDIPVSGKETAAAFYTGDMPGTYCAVLQGIAPTGLPCYATLFFDVH